LENDTAVGLEQLAHANLGLTQKTQNPPHWAY